jgi:3-isopropylmalate/(R)-2-methylmalate dehydratase large subunit
VRNPELTFAVSDHAISSAPGRNAAPGELGARLHGALKSRALSSGIRFFDLGEVGQGIVHVMGPELGLVLPGLTLICGDSHTCTNGALGAVASPIGASMQLRHVLATQTVWLKKPKTMRITLDGTPPFGEGSDPARDRRAGRRGRRGARDRVRRPAVRRAADRSPAHALQPRGGAGREGGIVAPDERTFEYLRGRPFAPEARTSPRRARSGGRCPATPRRCSTATTGSTRAGSRR